MKTLPSSYVCPLSTKLSVRFRIGDRVRIIPTLRLRFANEEGVVQSIVESRYSHTLDKCGFSESFTQGFFTIIHPPLVSCRVFLTQFSYSWQAAD
jgi:hypothetical protein